MKKIVLSALAVLTVAGAAMAQAPSIEFFWTERHGQTTIGPGAVPAASNNFNGAGAATDATIWLILSARLNTGNNPALRGIGGGAGNMVNNDILGAGAFRTIAGPPARIVSSASATSVPGFVDIRYHSTDIDGNYAVGTSPNANAIFQPFRFVADLAPGNVTGNISGNNLITNITWAAAGRELFGLDAGPGGEPAVNTEAQFGRNAIIPLYTFQYNVTNLTARTIDFTAQLAAFTAFSSYDVNGVPNSVTVTNGAVPSYRVTITPAPGAAALLGLGGLVAARRRRA